VKLTPERHTAPPMDYRLRLVSLYTTVAPGQGPVEPRTTREHAALTDSPGGPLAKREGCTCPRMHDARGHLAVYVDGHPMMLIREGCPVHTPLDTRARPEKGDRGAYRQTTGALRRIVDVGPDEQTPPTEPTDAEPAP
jgi:hypothetical protein